MRVGPEVECSRGYTLHIHQSLVQMLLHTYYWWCSEDVEVSSDILSGELYHIFDCFQRSEMAF
jgi:hypothetical protein